jgi:hypothetical protein
MVSASVAWVISPEKQLKSKKKTIKPISLEKKLLGFFIVLSAPLKL